MLGLWALGTASTLLFSNVDSLVQQWPRVIIHADLDAFYASVEQLDDPQLRGKPVLVGGSPEQRGVVAACSYEARGFGIRSAMPMRTALARCPDAILVPPRFVRYSEISKQVMGIFRRVATVIEPASLDEAYLDVTAAAWASSPRTVGNRLKMDVKQGTGLRVSVGMATSKSVAKIASDQDKPDGFCIVPPDSERGFLAPLPVKKLTGIGPKTSALLISAGVDTLGDLAGKPDFWLEKRIGKRGLELARHARGEDYREVAPRSGAKSVSVETTFPRDIGDAELLLGATASLSGRLATRMEKHQQWGRTVTIKLRLADFTTFTRSATQAMPLRGREDLEKIAKDLVRAELEPERRFRLVGISVSSFAEDTPQLALL